MHFLCLIVAVSLRLDSTAAQGAAIAPNGAPIADKMASSLMSPTPYMYKVQLSPHNEVPRISDSKALGYLLVQFMPDTNAIYYDLVVSNIYAPTVAHIHVGNASTVNGTTLMFLYNATETPSSTTPFSGRLAKGILTPVDFEGPAKNMTVATFIDKYVKLSDLYSNVHTTQHSLGLIRGQINAYSLQGSLAARVPPVAPNIAPANPL